MSNICAVITEKGGAGKSTVTLGLASAASAADARVLVVDLDPQGSASFVLGVDDGAGHLVRALDAERPGGARDEIVGSSWSPDVAVLPGARDLRAWDPGGTTKTHATRLARALRRVADEYDLVLVDCPPGLGVLAVQALAAADHALIVTEPSALAIHAVEPVADLVDEVWHRYNPELDLAGVVVNRVPAVSNEADRQYDALGRIVGRRSIWKPVVPQRVILNQAAGDRRPIHAYGARSADVADVFDRLHRKLARLTAG